ncbi:MAG: class I SAM-dependent methyltransferase [Gallionellaceae bacterium]|nr:class I SAM-dependent methyltransferase [Gallionellaceae bacterium]
MKCSSTDHARFDEAAVAAVVRSWSFITTPIRPSAEILAEYRKHFERSASQPILIFGATPELIDLALEVGCPEVVSMDWNADNFEAMRRIASREWDNVTFQHGNWVVPIEDLNDRFGCVASDAGPIFLSFPEQWQGISAAAYGYLQSGGRWVSRSFDWPGEAQPFEAYFQRHVDDFEAARKTLNREDELTAFKALTVHIRLRSMQNVVDGHGMIDQQEFARRNDQAARILIETYPDPAFREVVDMNLLRLVRPRPDQSDLQSVVPPELACLPLQKMGFRTEVWHFSEAIPNSGFLLAASKP